MKIFINRKPVEGPWGGGNLFLKAFCAFFRAAGHQVVFDLADDIDCIWIQDPRPGNTGISIREILRFKNSKPLTKIFHRVNECDARKGTTEMDDLLRLCSHASDFTIFVSDWIRDYHLAKGWQCENYDVIYNGVDLEHFRPRPKLQNGKINIITHHWSSNEMKGQDYYRFLDDFVGREEGFTFTYIGNCNDRYRNSKIIPPLHGLLLGEELSKYDIYISGTRFDPGPNHIIESIASGIPTFAYSGGGGAVEFVGSENTFSNTEQLEEILKSDFSATANKHKPYRWEDCIRKVLDVVVARVN